MNKRKVLSILLLALITVTLAVSCSGSIDAPVQDAEELAYVTFGNGHSRGLSTSYETEPYDNLYWFYTAQKTDSYGTTGQVGLSSNRPTAAVSKYDNNAPKKGLSGQVGPFSQGAWKFKLYAYAEDTANSGPDMNNLIYSSEEVAVTLKGNEVKNVPVSVSLNGETGLVNLSGAWFEWANESDAQGKISVTVELAKDGLPPTTYFFGPLTRSNDKYTFTTTTDTKRVNEGYYTCTVNAYMEGDVDVTEETVNADATPLATQTLGLRVYGNATTFITGNLTEGIFAKVVFDVAEQDMKVFVPLENGSAEIKGISVTPAGDSSKTTSVKFSAGALSDIQDNATLQLDVKVTPVESANEKFSITGVDSSYRSAFAGIDITLMQTTANGQPVAVDSFNENPATTATVTTYIAKGLSNVQVKYSGNPDETINSTYDPDDGCLSFTTYHFSEYYVLADCIALNTSTNVGYKSLADAINAVGNDETIKLIRNSEGSGIKVSSGKKFTVDFNDCTYDVNGNLVGSSGTETNVLQLLKDSTIVFKNGRLTSTVNKYNSQILIQNYSNLTLDNMVVDAEDPFDYILSNNNGEVVIKDTTITSRTGKVAFDVCRYASYDGPRVTVEGNSVINGKVEISSSGHKDGARHELVVTDGTFNGSIYKLGVSPDFVGSITGGTFSSDPSEYLALDKMAVLKDGMYHIENDPRIKTEEQLKSAVENGGEITLGADIQLTGELKIAKDVTLILGEYKITGKEKSSAIVLNTEEGPVNVTVNATSGGVIGTGSTGNCFKMPWYNEDSSVLTVNGGSYKSNSSYLLDIGNSNSDNRRDKFFIKGCTYTGNRIINASQSNTEIYMTAGSLTGTSGGIVFGDNSTNASFTMTGGEISYASGSVITAQASGNTINIRDTAKVTGMLSLSNCEMNITGGIVNITGSTTDNRALMISTGSKLNISGDAKVKGDPLFNMNGGTVNIKGGSFSGKIVNGLNYGNSYLQSVKDLLSAEYKLSEPDSNGWYQVNSTN